MRIGFDISQTGDNKAGCGYFADSLIQALTKFDHQNQYILYPYFGTSFWDRKAAITTRRIRRPNVSRKLVLGSHEQSMAFWRNLPADAEARLGNPDIIHSNNYSCPRGLSRARVVYTVYDLSFLDYPELTTEQNRCVCFEGVFSASVHADFVVSISHYSRDRFLKLFPHYPEERIRTVYLASRLLAADDSVKPTRRLAGLKAKRFWLCVGTLEPRKNMRRLLRAFALYREQISAEYPLVLAGGEGWLEENLGDYISGLGLIEDVRILGYVSDEELRWLYSNCFCFVYPSLYEGFGLPVVEAMELGAAVITSRSSSLPEVAGEAAHYVNPADESELAQALLTLSNDDDYRRELTRRAVVQAKKFSWQKSAFEVLDIYRQVMAMPKFCESVT